MEKAPFFLPTLPGVEHRFAVEEKTEEVTKGKKSAKRPKDTTTEAESTFLRKLRRESTSGSCEHPFDSLGVVFPRGDRGSLSNDPLFFVLTVL